jgi:tetratricopeptide (TPR) repeat protein
MRKRLYKDTDHPDVAISLNNLGASYDSKREFEKALEYYEEAMKMLKRYHKGFDHPDISTSLNNIGVSYENMGDQSKAMKYYEEALEMRTRIYRGDMTHPDVVMSVNSLKNLKERMNFDKNNDL